MENSIKRMKETLTLIADVAESLEAELKRNHAPSNQIQDVANIRNIARDAAAFRLRNCDVGTAEEQQQRFEHFCRKTKLGRIEATAYCAYECPCKAWDCKFAWEQMPYESEAKE